MIFVTVGTQKQQFIRLMKMLDNSKELEQDEIIVQSGHTQYKSSKLKQIEFISPEEIEQYIDKAEIVICHGGVGSIFSALRKNKKVLVVPRLSEYGEHINNHQLEICEQLEKDGYILYVKNENDFDKMIRKLRKRKIKTYRYDESFLEKLRNEI